MRAPAMVRCVGGDEVKTALLTLAPLGTVVSAQQPPAPVPSRWQLTLSRSKMDDSQTVVLALQADAPVPVWLKRVVPVLILRCQEKVLDTYIHVLTASS